jgi:hypothetical protein
MRSHLTVNAVALCPFLCFSQFVIVHNSLMSIGSAVLWLAMVAELLLIYWGHDLWSLACDPRGLHTSGPIYFIYYVNYIFKVRREQKQNCPFRTQRRVTAAGKQTSQPAEGLLRSIVLSSVSVAVLPVCLCSTSN